eukprot:gene4642-14841_t
MEDQSRPEDEEVEEVVYQAVEEVDVVWVILEGMGEAEKAINSLNGFEMDGRNIMVREDREDRDVKPYQEGGGFAPPVPQGGFAPPGARGGFAPGYGGGGGFAPGYGGGGGGGYGGGGGGFGGGGGYGGGGGGFGGSYGVPRFSPYGGGREVRGGGGGRDAYGGGEREVRGGGGREVRGAGGGREAYGGRERESRGAGSSRGGGRTGESSGKQVVVQGLPWSYTWKELKDMFQSVRGLDRADVTLGSDGRSKDFGTGYGIVSFSNPAAAQEAIDMWHEKDLEGRTLAVFLDKFEGGREGRGAGGGSGGGEREVRGAAGGRSEGRTGESTGMKVVVQGLPWSYTWKELKDMFQSVRGLDRADVTIGSDGRSKGYGIVSFSSLAAAQEAIAMWHEKELEGRTLAVFLDKFEGGREGRGAGGGSGGGEREVRGAASGRGEGRTGESTGLQVVVQGLPWSHTWKELKDMFQSVRGLERADVTIGFDGRSRGFGTVSFSNTAAAQEAIAMWHEKELEGRTLAVFLDKFA